MAKTGLKIERLQGKIKSAWLSQMNNENGEDYLDKMSRSLAKAIVEEISELIVEIPAGIKVNTTGGAGQTIEIKIADLR